VTPATLAQARKAKPKLLAMLDSMPEVRGVGIAALDGGFVLKVNLASDRSRCAIPGEIDGVPVITQIVGPIQSL